MKELEEKIAKLANMSNEELILAYDRAHDLNVSKKSLGHGELSGQYENACYKEMLRRMAR